MITNYNEFFNNNLIQSNSRLFKESLLMEFKDDQLLQRILKLALDPTINFWIKKIPFYEVKDTTLSLTDALNLLNKLSDRVVTGNEGIEHLKYILSNVSINDAEVIKRIIQKDLRCGVSISTVNKIFPNLIFEYPCLLCSRYSTKLVNKIKFPAIVQKKSDGTRFNAIVKNNNVEFRTRNGNLMDFKGNLEQEFIILAKGEDLVFDGELLIKKDNKILDRKTGNGIINRAIKGTITESEAATVVVDLWDIIPYSDFYNKKYNVPYNQRLLKLTNTINEFKLDRISLIETYNVNSIEEVDNLFQFYINNEFEGIILKDKSAIWEDKKSTKQIKFKSEKDCDLRCIGIEEGKGKYKGMIGALKCISEDGILSVSVGSKLNATDRKLPHSEFLNKIICVKYNTRINNKQGEETLFLPIFQGVRNDKDVADYISSIE